MSATVTHIQRSASQAHFPFLKTVDEFDFLSPVHLRLSFLAATERHPWN